MYLLDEWGGVHGVAIQIYIGKVLWKLSRFLRFTVGIQLNHMKLMSSISLFLEAISKSICGIGGFFIIFQRGRV